MGFFNFVFNSRHSYSRYGGATEEYRAALREMRKQRSKAYRTVRTILIFAFVLATTLFILGAVVPSMRHAWLFKMVFIVYAITVGGLMTLPWITALDRDAKAAAKGEAVPTWHKIVTYVFFGLIGVCTLLWIISVFIIGDGVEVLISRIFSDGAATDYDFGNTFLMLRISLITTLQVAIGSIIATTTLRYGTKYLGLRIAIYVTSLYLDIWLSWFIGGVTIKGLENGFAPISVTFLWVLAVLMFVALIVATSIFNAQTRRKEIELLMKGDVDTLTSGDVNLIDAQAKNTFIESAKPKEEPKQTAEQDPEQHLAKIKELFEKGVISEEEYKEKRKDIIDKM